MSKDAETLIGHILDSIHLPEFEQKLKDISEKIK
jgi:hypothetical protein